MDQTTLALVYCGPFDWVDSALPLILGTNHLVSVLPATCMRSMCALRFLSFIWLEKRSLEPVFRSGHFSVASWRLNGWRILNRSVCIRHWSVNWQSYSINDYTSLIPLQCSTGRHCSPSKVWLWWSVGIPGGIWHPGMRAVAQADMPSWVYRPFNGLHWWWQPVVSWRRLYHG